ncbi:bifunctional metallophosphatase/5'-nucleotidase [Peterkaempfera bronchialis]|uniref:Bifunctional metallophosphatase/5'-nucleotidase n=1 Tax=Peterkaempfera bronchialis TaxID=2126346 RepID=A0A345STH8_9ACTN|nr:5'-nucleotidase C-terminal domain-containing protein [Peterkaempfera bronchialis]AXI77033.1 bifunctional metallophosphatase/5'-nucleotidase [Peterkaempfera bronchialis]
MPLNRRDFVARSAATAAGAALVGGASVAAAQPAAAVSKPKKHAVTESFTVLGTTDLHGNALNWDYFTDAEYDDNDHNDVGLAKISTLVNRIRKEKGHHRTLLIDAGDTIQGTQLSYYYARVEPIDQGGRHAPVHPMALAMNRIGYDAAALGNHEFNYGIPLLRAFEKQCHFPLLGANALDVRTERPAFPPYVIRKVRTHCGRHIRVGILGLTNPGIAIWDKANVQGKMTFGGIVEQAKVWVPKLRAAGADVVIVSAHTGADQVSSYGDQLPWPENAGVAVAEQVPGIDAMLIGHAHVEIPQRIVVNKKTGRKVVLAEPLKWGERLARFDFDAELVHGCWQVTGVRSTVINSNTVPEDPAVVSLLAAEHKKVVAYVNQVIGTCKEALSIAEAPFRDTPIIDLIGRVQVDTVKAALAGTAYAGLPVLSQVAPFNRTAAIPAGQVKLRDAAGLYIYENTLEARKLTGAQLRDYLEYSMRYFAQLPVGAPVDKAKLTNADGIPDYNFDSVYGVSYDVDISQPVGRRIVNLSYNGAPLDPAAEFVLAVNNYRANGGGNFPHIAAAPVLWSNSEEIRNTMIGWVKAKGAIDPADFASVDWRLVREGVPVF